MNKRQVAKELLKLAKSITSVYDHGQMEKMITKLGPYGRKANGEIKNMTNFLKRAKDSVDQQDVYSYLLDARDSVERARDALSDVWSRIEDAVEYIDREHTE
jgi:hypothetical protein